MDFFVNCYPVCKNDGRRETQCSTKPTTPACAQESLHAWINLNSKIIQTFSMLQIIIKQRICMKYFD